MNPFMNPILWLGARAFRRHRLESYEALAESLGDSSRTAPVTLRKTIQKWAERDKARGDTRAAVFALIEYRLGLGGTSFAQALRPFIPDDEFLILSAGEVNGDIKNSFDLLIRNIAATSSMNEAVKAAMAQPALGFASLFGLSIFNGVMVWPTFVQAIPRKYWPSWTLPCIDFQIWLASHWYVVLFVFVFVALYYATLKTWTGPSRDWADHLPPWSIYKARQASSLLGVMAALVSSGRTVRQSYAAVQKMSTPYMAWHLGRMLRLYDSSGADPMSSIKTGLFTRPIVDRIEDAKDNRNFEKTLAYVGDTSLKVIVRLVAQQATSANLLFMVLIGIGFVYMTVVSVVGAQDATDAYTKFVQGGAALK